MRIIVSCVLMVLLPISILFSCGEDDDWGRTDFSTYGTDGNGRGRGGPRLSSCDAIEKCETGSNCCKDDDDCKSDCRLLGNRTDCEKLPLDIAIGDLQPVLEFLKSFAEDKGDNLREENYNALCGWIKGFGKEEVFTEQIEGSSDGKKFLTWFASNEGVGEAGPWRLFNSIQKDDAKKIVRLAFGKLGDNSADNSNPTDAEVISGVDVSVDDGDNFFELAVDEYSLDDDGSDQDGKDFFELLHDLIIDPVCDDESNQPEVARRTHSEEYTREACYLAFYCKVFPAASDGQQPREKVAALDLEEYLDVEEFIKEDAENGGLVGLGGLTASDKEDAAEKWNNKACRALLTFYDNPAPIDWDL